MIFMVFLCNFRVNQMPNVRAVLLGKILLTQHSRPGFFKPMDRKVFLELLWPLKSQVYSQVPGGSFQP